MVVKKDMIDSKTAREFRITPYTRIPSLSFDRWPHLEKVIINGPVVLDDFLFSNCIALKTVIINNGPVELGEGAFSYCDNLEEVIGSENITLFSDQCFAHCKSLTHIEFGPDVEAICESAFDLSGLVEADLTNVREIKPFAFSYCGDLERVVMSKYAEEIPDNMCDNCHKLKEFVFGENVARIGRHAFINAKKLSNAVLPKSLIDIDHGAFYDAGLKSVNFDELPNLQFIGVFAFFGCSIQKITMPSNITEIGASAFFNTPLREIDLSHAYNLSHIGEGAFAATNLNALDLSNTMVVDKLDDYDDINIVNSYYSGEKMKGDEI